MIFLTDCWPAELCLWGLAVFALGILFYYLKSSLNRNLSGLAFMMMVIGTLFVQTSYIYLLIDNLKTVAVIAFLIAVAAALRPFIVERRQRFKFLS